MKSNNESLAFKKLSTDISSTFNADHWLFDHLNSKLHCFNTKTAIISQFVTTICSFRNQCEQSSTNNIILQQIIYTSLLRVDIT